ncbi:PrcB protein [Psychroflexus sp. CAK8W]|uniref:PrcB protein n=1 Tax=Psychroflexus longus TaxID=2873596 RepID=A0ABS7XLV9_9FLAO|nr:PrcB protein [Psychroflexus longus]MBZ9779484.1 PrcB protein [Psychroflexus longus]
MKNFILLMVSFVLFSCSNEDDMLVNSDLKLVKEGVFSSENENLAEQNWLISSQSEFESTFSEEPEFLNLFQDNPFDFETHIMLISTDEIRTSGGYSVNIQFDGETQNEVFFKIQYNSPEDGLVTLPVYIPYQAKKYPVTDKTIQFRN